MKASEVINMFKNSSMLARHGDVVLVKVPTPNVETLDDDPRGVVADGEATGHAHRVVSKAKVAKIKGEVDQMLIKAFGKTYIDHEEHAKGELKRGTYITGIQRQYNPEGWSKVVD